MSLACGWLPRTWGKYIVTGEALHILVGGSLDDLQAAHLVRVRKAYSGLVLYRDQTAMLGNLKIVGVLIQAEALRRGALLHEMPAVLHAAHLIHTNAGLGEGTHQHGNQFLQKG